MQPTRQIRPFYAENFHCIGSACEDTCCRGWSVPIEKATYEDVAVRFLAADQHPDHDTIAAFRQEYLQPLAELFRQALLLCQRAGLVKLGNVALDGTKLRANASRGRSVSAARLAEQEKEWQTGYGTPFSLPAKTTEKPAASPTGQYSPWSNLRE